MSDIFPINMDENQVIGFDFLFQVTRQPIFVVCFDMDTRSALMHKMNQSALELIKISPDEMSGINPVEIGLFANENELVKHAENENNLEGLAYLAKIKAESDQYISSEITLFRKQHQNIVYLIAFQRNMGNTNKMLEALRHSEFRFLQMAENITEGIIIAEEGKIVFINSSICHITGYNKEQLRDMDETILARDDERERVKAFRQKITESPQGIQGLEYWIKTRSGQEKCLKNTYTFSQKSNGKYSTYIITTDITARKRVEQALLKSQTEFRMLADNSPDLITRYSRDLTYSYANQTVELLTGIPVAKIIGRNNLDIGLDAEVAAFIEEMHLEVFRTGRKLKFEYRLQKDGEFRVFQSHMVPELSKEGAVESVLNVSRDITQIKNVEKALKEEKQNIIDENQLIAKNLKSWCYQLCTSPEHGENAAQCLSPIMRIAEWAQSGFYQQSFTPKPVNINQLLSVYYDEKRKKISTDKIELVLNIPQNQISVFSDSNILTNTIDYLMENAIEATESGKIELGYDVYNENEIVIFVKDTGIGIEPDLTEQIFEPFYFYKKEGHAGLGLSIARKNVKTMQGQIWCLSAIGTGSTFCFTHPAQVEKAQLSQSQGNGEKNWSHRKIHVVEDTNENYVLIETILRKYKPQLTRSITGEEAIEFLKTNTDIDLVLMDIQLPGRNGYETTGIIREFNAKVPIIAQTAYAMYDDVVKALDSGCNDFIAKPIKIKKFVSLLEKYLD